MPAPFLVALYIVLASHQVHVTSVWILAGCAVGAWCGVQMSMDSNSFSVLSDNQKVYKSTGVRSYPISCLPRLPWNPLFQSRSSSEQPRLILRMPHKGFTCERPAARWFACGHTDMRVVKHARTAILESTHAFARCERRQRKRGRGAC